VRGGERPYRTSHVLHTGQPTHCEVYANQAWNATGFTSNKGATDSRLTDSGSTVESRSARAAPETADSTHRRWSN
jgi:hypothetical protein